MVGVKQQAYVSSNPEPSWQFVSGKGRGIRQSPERVSSSYATGFSWKGNSSSRVPSHQFPSERMVGYDVKHHSPGMNHNPSQTHWTSTQQCSPNLNRPSDVSIGDYLPRPKSQPTPQSKREHMYILKLNEAIIIIVLLLPVNLICSCIMSLMCYILFTGSRKKKKK